MLSSALMAVLITATPSHPSKPAPAAPQMNSVCSAQFDPNFVHFVEKTPGEKPGPGLRLVADASKATPLVTAGAASCVTELTRGELVR